jgi:hypothetical protein
MQFTVGIKLDGKAKHVTVRGEDALVAALRVKAEHPNCRITYVRPMNKRGDARHPSLPVSSDLH